MSDLTEIAERVLVAQRVNGTGAYITRYTEPTLTCANAAPPLAAAVLRVEALVDRLDDGHLRHLIRTTLNGDDQ